jgi:predicted RNA-binding Zn ribbon-like protein
VTGQERYDSYSDIGVAVAVELINSLTLDHAFGRAVEQEDAVVVIRRVLDVRPPFPQVRSRDVPGVFSLAMQLRAVVRDAAEGDLDAAATRLNRLLAAHPAYPHLAKDQGRWRLHHHPVDAAVVPMVTAVCAQALARLIGDEPGGRMGTCEAHVCERVFVDVSKNSSRRFCSTSCQSRVKAAAFRRRRSG